MSGENAERCFPETLTETAFSIHRKLFMSESGIDVYEGPSFLLYDRVHTWDNPCDFIVYYVLAGVECGAR